MSWITRLLGLDGPLAVAGNASLTPVATGYLSPWADPSPLSRVIYATEIFGVGDNTVDRGAAMAVAPINRGRKIIVGAIADLTPIAGSFAGSTFTPAGRQPTFLTRARPPATPWHRLAGTVDDLIFYGWSLWALERSDAGTVLDALRIPRDRWEFDSTALLGIRIGDYSPTDPATVCLFQGPDEGLLATGADIIRGARAMERAWVGRVQSPIPATVLQETERNGVTQDEADDILAAWRAARQSPTGAIGFLPSTLEMKVYGDTNADLFTEGRNNVRLDVANFLNLPASLLDGSTATASLTYQTAQGQFSQLNEYLTYWLAPIEARLSADDITPQGQVVRFDRAPLSASSDYGTAAEIATDDTPVETAVPEAVAA